MSFYESLLAQTQAERDYLLGAPIIQQAMTGRSPCAATLPSLPRPTTTSSTPYRC